MHTPSDTARSIRVCVATHDYTTARETVLHAAREGRAQLLPAWARHNNTARVLIDGEEVGQASVLCAYVRETVSVDGPTMFSRYGDAMTVRRLVPERDIFLPVRLRG